MLSVHLYSSLVYNILILSVLVFAVEVRWKVCASNICNGCRGNTSERNQRNYGPNFVLDKTFLFFFPPNVSRFYVMNQILHNRTPPS